MTGRKTHNPAHRGPATTVAAPALRHVSDAEPGFTRQRQGRGFAYRDAEGTPLRDPAHLRRIRSLAIPPAYTAVWICADPRGHIQATGRDARGRKQYRYHPAWREARDQHKYDRLLDLAGALPRIRARVRRDLEASHGPPGRDAAMAAVVRLLDTTMVRVGNDEYARDNGSFGLTTLRRRHAQLQGSTLRLRFRGKSGVMHEVAVDDPRVARIIRRCQGLPGQELFQYLDGDQLRSVGSADVNDYLRAAAGAEFTAKDFRTWHGSVLALALATVGAATGGAGTEAQPQSPPATATSILREVAAQLGNTVAVCRKSYVHPRVLEVLGSAAACGVEPAPPRRGLTAHERRFVAFLASG